MPNWKDTRRRLKQGMAERLGLVEGSGDDHAFHDEHLDFRNTTTKLRSLQKAMRLHLEAVQHSVATGAALAVELADFLKDSEAADVTCQLGHALTNIERKQLAAVERLYDDEVLGATDVLLNEVPDIEAKVKRRKDLILDLNAHTRKFEQLSVDLQELRSGGKRKGSLFSGRRNETELAQEVESRKRKMAIAESEVTASTKYLIDRFRQIEEHRGSGLMLAEPMAAVVACHLHLARETDRRLSPFRHAFQGKPEAFGATLLKYDAEALTTSLARTTLHTNTNTDALRVFGQSLGTRAALPFVVEECVEFMRSNNAAQEHGIFRIPGNNGQVNAYKAAYDAGKKRVLLEADEDETRARVDLNDVATLLKMYFHFIGAIKNDQDVRFPKTIDAVIDVVKRIRPSHQNLLSYLAENKMTAQNLGTCFAPSLIRPPDDVNPAAMLGEMPAAIAAVRVLIQHGPERLPPPTTSSSAATAAAAPALPPGLGFTTAGGVSPRPPRPTGHAPPPRKRSTASDSEEWVGPAQAPPTRRESATPPPIPSSVVSPSKRRSAQAGKSIFHEGLGDVPGTGTSTSAHHGAPAYPPPPLPPSAQRRAMRAKLEQQKTNLRFDPDL